MKINPDKCVACGNCTYVCPVGAIYIDPNIRRATINRDACVECYTCFNGLSQEHLNPTFVRALRRVFQALRLRFDPEPDVCPTAAFEPDELVWPRTVRRAFSDPRVPHESTGVHGRGTEEVKTNDISGRVGLGEVGFTIEFGRPGVGVWFRDLQTMCSALAQAGVTFEKRNPVTSLMSDVATGTIREDIMDEKVLSAIIEIKVPVERAEEIIRLVWKVEKQIDTVVALGVGAHSNTLHRFGSAQSFADDYIVFAMCARGKNDRDAVPKLRKFLEMAVPFSPVNLGDAIHGGALRPSREMNPLAHWNRDRNLDFQAVIDGLDQLTTAAAVFDNQVAAEDFVKAVKEADLGLSINISTSIDGAEQCCFAAGIPRHSVGYSLGFEGKTEKLPNADVLLLSTMCGHGMVSQSLAQKMIDWVKEGRRTPEQAAGYLTRFCSCGVFNPARAARVLKQAARGMLSK